MIEHRVGDLLEQLDLDFIAHQCNLYHTFGSGIARQIREKFPWAYAADCAYTKGDRSRLGTYSLGIAPRPPETIEAVFNLYCQDGVSATHRTTDYDAMGKVLFSVERFLKEIKEKFHYPEDDLFLGVPYKMGCGLAGGDWDIVLPIMEMVFADSPVTLVICRKGDA